MATTFIEKTAEGIPVIETLGTSEIEPKVKGGRIWEVLRLFMGWTSW